MTVKRKRLLAYLIGFLLGCTIRFLTYTSERADRSPLFAWMSFLTAGFVGAGIANYIAERRGWLIESESEEESH